MLLMTAKMGGTGVEGGGCGESVGDVYTRFAGMLVGRGAGDDSHYKAGKKGNQQYHGRLIS
jgi:hypothetical protein